MPTFREELETRFIDAMRNVPGSELFIKESLGKCTHCRRKIALWENYMVTNDVWLSAMKTERGILHLKCLEVKLGRELRENDFTVTPIEMLQNIHDYLLNPPAQQIPNPKSTKRRENTMAKS